MFYAITNIVESGRGSQDPELLTRVKFMRNCQKFQSMPFIVLLVFNDTVKNVRYNVEHGHQFYWCLTPLSTMLVIA
jgi:hypothetical protein